MRIVSYNILDGGEGRADPLAETIEAQRPDVVALVEATDKAVVERIANRLGMDYIQAIGNRQASALLTKYTIRDTVNHALLHKGLSKSLLEAMIIDAHGQPWVFGVLHLQHHHTEADERNREAELEIVLDIFARHRGDQVPHILAGDFNADSPVQEIDPAKLKASSREAYDANGGQLPRRVIQKLLDAGYMDTLAIAEPALAKTAGTFTTQHPGQRVDYIFVHSLDASRITAAGVETDRLAKYASDHFPVFAEIG
ncbi:MAG TPA: endonuclease/exonuclease/phosphatase family protein [Tepidisphaeraceae bacterium]|jgi:endonuclease/exonuclease/phosphatase family metal-dependent hydrolase